MTVECTTTLRDVSRRLWDVLVIGAGPAGSIVARQLARGGCASVLLVDRAIFPRFKVCGCCLSARALALLEAIGLGNLVEKHGGLVVDQLIINTRAQHAQVRLPRGAVLSRQQFDAALIREAIAAGAEFLPSTNVSPGALTIGDDQVTLRLDCNCDQSTTQLVSTRIVIDASGLRGRPESRCRDSYIGSGAILEGDHEDALPLPAGAIQMICGNGGYIGLARLGRDRVVIGAAWSPGFVKECGGFGGAAARIMRHAGVPECSLLEDAKWRSTPWLTQSPCSVAGMRRLLIGDAAGFVEPFTGEGMTCALESAVAAAPLVLEALRRRAWDRALERRWSQMHRGIVGGRQRSCRAIARLLRRPHVTELAVALLAAVPPLTAGLVRRAAPISGLQLRSVSANVIGAAAAAEATAAAS